MRRALAVLILLAASLPDLAFAIPHVVLVQNSGWMEPFYSDPQSAFKPLVTELVSSVVQPGDALVLAAFNQGVPGAPSPRGLLSLKVGGAADARAQVNGALAALAPADTIARLRRGAEIDDPEPDEA